MRDNIILVGTNHARAPIAVRERLAFSPDALAAALASPPAGVSELAILSTCNRSEFYALVADRGDRAGMLLSWIAGLTGIDLADLQDATYSLPGHNAVSHLFKVASGLDSMVLGEPHILGQVRKAFDQAMTADAAGPVLSRLGQDAVHLGKLVRTQTGLARNRLSIPHAAVDLAARHIKSWSKSRVVVVGAGEMGSLAAKVLRSTGAGELVVVNRNEDRGRALAATVDARFAPVSQLMSEVDDADLVISAVSVESFLLRPRDLETRTRPLVVVDLGVPRTVDPDLRVSPAVRLFDVDDLEQFSSGRRDASTADIEQAEFLLEEARGAFLRWWAARKSAPAIAELSGKAEQIREAELERALRKLSHLSDRDRNVVSALSVGIVNKLLHEPITNLRGGRDHDETTALRLFGIQPAPADHNEPDMNGSQARVAAWETRQ